MSYMKMVNQNLSLSYLLKLNVTATHGGYTAEMALLRKQFNKYFSLPSGFLVWFGETCSSETFSVYLHQNSFSPFCGSR